MTRRPIPQPVDGLLVPRELLPALDWALRTAWTNSPPPPHLAPAVEALTGGLVELSRHGRDTGPLPGVGGASSSTTASQDEVTVTRDQAAETLGITPNGVSKAVRRGHLVDVGPGRTVAITTASLQAELARRDQAA